MRLFDGIYQPKTRKKTRARRSWWFFVILIMVLAGFTYAGAAGAAFVLPKIDLLKLFQNGKYLVLLQNNAELRSSGGFIGSYAMIDLKNFEVQNLSFNTNIYALDHAFAEKSYVKAPAPVDKMLNEQTWALRDANYAASFPEAAETVKFFYEKESGDKIDGVVALNAKVIVDLLELTGPIETKSGVTITAENFYQETQSQIEQIYYQKPENWAINEPKSFLKELYPALISRALNNKIALIETLRQDLDTKEIMFYFTDPLKNQLIQKYHLTGEMPAAAVLQDEDYLYINSNSYSSNKSSLSVQDSVQYRLATTDENKTTVNLTLNRLHKGTADWPDGKNYEWMRIFVAPGAEFQSATLNGQYLEIEPGEESGHNYYGMYVTTEPGAANIIELSYTIPTQSDYHLLIQKQPGKSDTPLTVSRDGALLFDGILDRDLKI